MGAVGGGGGAGGSTPKSVTGFMLLLSHELMTSGSIEYQLIHQSITAVNFERLL